MTPENGPDAPHPQQPWAVTRPAADVAVAAYQYLLQVTPGRVSGRVSDFRAATLTLDPDGATLDGRAFYSTGKQVLVLVASVFVGILIGVLLGILLLEYVLRDPKRLRLTWENVDEIVLQPEKAKACIVYREPGRPGRALSLAFRLMPPYYENFVGAARYFAPGKVREGKIAGPTPWGAVVALIVFALLIIAAVVFVGGS